MLHWHIISRRDVPSKKCSSGAKCAYPFTKTAFLSSHFRQRDFSQPNNESRRCSFCVKSQLSRPYLRTKSCYGWQLNLIPQLLILDSLQTLAFVQSRSGRSGKTECGSREWVLSNGPFCVHWSRPNHSGSLGEILCFDKPHSSEHPVFKAESMCLCGRWRRRPWTACGVETWSIYLGLWRCIWPWRPEETLINLFASESRLTALTLPGAELVFAWCAGAGLCGPLCGWKHLRCVFSAIAMCWDSFKPIGNTNWLHLRCLCLFLTSFSPHSPPLPPWPGRPSAAGPIHMILVLHKVLSCLKGFSFPCL